MASSRRIALATLQIDFSPLHPPQAPLATASAAEPELDASAPGEVRAARESYRPGSAQQQSKDSSQPEGSDLCDGCSEEASAAFTLPSTQVMDDFEMGAAEEQELADVQCNLFGEPSATAAAQPSHTSIYKSSTVRA